MIYERTENIYLYKPDINSITPNKNGGDISNYHIAYQLPSTLFGIGKEYLDNGYVWRKLFIYNKTNRVIKKLCVFAPPDNSGFDYFTASAQWYLNYGDTTNLDDVENDIDSSKSFGLLKPHHDISMMDNGIRVFYPARENNMNQVIDLKNHSILLYDNVLSHEGEYSMVVNTFQTPDYLYLDTESIFKSSYKASDTYVVTGLVFDDIPVNGLVKFWIGIDFYDTTSDYVIDFKLNFMWEEVSLE